MLGLERVRYMAERSIKENGRIVSLQFCSKTTDLDSLIAHNTANTSVLEQKLKQNHAKSFPNSQEVLQAVFFVDLHNVLFDVACSIDQIIYTSRVGNTAVVSP